MGSHLKATTKFKLMTSSLLMFSTITSCGATPDPQQEIQRLKNQINQIMTRIDHLETNPPSQAPSQTPAKKNTQTEIAFSGRVNRAVLWANNGHNSSTQHVDNGNANSLVNVTATHKYTARTNFGAEVEAKMRQNSSDSTDVKFSSNGSVPITVRKLNAFIDDKKFGKIYFGRASSASNMTMENTDLSGTDVISCGASIASMAGGTTFLNKATNARLYDANKTATSRYKNLINSDDGKININAVFGGNDASGIDGMGYQDLVRYDTPTMHGFVVSTSHAYQSPKDGQGNDLFDVALKHASEWQKNKIAAQVAFVKNNTVPLSIGTATGYTQVNGSVGILHTSGFNVQLSGTHRNWKYGNTHDAKQYGAKLGYQQQFWPCGMTAFVVDYGHFENFVIDATSYDTLRNQFVGKTYGAFITQSLDRISSQLYLGWRRHELTIKGSDVNAYHINAVMGGMLVKF